MDLFSIQAQWEDLKAHLASHQGSFTVDLSSVGDLDLAGLQLLLALDRHLAARGDRLSLSGVKPAWRDRFRLLGLAALLEGRP
ncbi:MAG: STAS domain-containing protein [Acidobacteriota bacterium]|nr:STAS domain-containing protein [Acidobacteriota bacterium]